MEHDHDWASALQAYDSLPSDAGSHAIASASTRREAGVASALGQLGCQQLLSSFYASLARNGQQVQSGISEQMFEGSWRACKWCDCVTRFVW